MFYNVTNFQLIKSVGHLLSRHLSHARGDVNSGRQQHLDNLHVSCASTHVLVLHTYYIHISDELTPTTNTVS